MLQINPRPLHGIETGFPMVVALAQQCNTGEQHSVVMLYTYIDRDAEAPDENMNKVFVHN